MPKEITKIYLILRRRYYLKFKQQYIIKSIAERKGKCNRCSCCEIKILGLKINCQEFNKENKTCKLYDKIEMPKTCCIYPFDEKDKWPEYKEKCGFYWEKEGNKK